MHCSSEAEVGDTQLDSQKVSSSSWQSMCSAAPFVEGAGPIDTPWARRTAVIEEIQEWKERQGWALRQQLCIKILANWVCAKIGYPL